MKGIEYDALGNLQVVSQAVPQPKANEVCIKIEMTSLNYADLKQWYAGASSFGLDVAGTIEEVGNDVVGFERGDRVIAFPNSNGHAEYATAKQQLVYKIADSVSWEQAGASPIVSFLSYMLINDVAQLTANHTVIIHSASGGVGSTAIQFAKRAGAKTIVGTVGSLAKADRAVNAGADYVFTYESFADEVMKLTGGKGADIVLDSIAGDVTLESMRALANFGKLIQFGNSSGKPASLSTSDVHKSCRTVVGFSFGTTRKERPSYVQQVASQVIPVLNAGHVQAHIDRIFPLSEAIEAYTYFKSRKHSGKILLKVDQA